jgi:hypothetical protein
LTTLAAGSWHSWITGVISNDHWRHLYKPHRRAIMTDLNVVKVLDHLGIATATDDEVDAALEDQSD